MQANLIRLSHANMWYYSLYFPVPAKICAIMQTALVYLSTIKAEVLNSEQRERNEKEII